VRKPDFQKPKYLAIKKSTKYVIFHDCRGGKPEGWGGKVDGCRAFGGLVGGEGKQGRFGGF
jgi:hypothetical protein